MHDTEPPVRIYIPHSLDSEHPAMPDLSDAPVRIYTPAK